MKAEGRSLFLDLPIASVLANPRQEWTRIASGDGRIRVARELDVDWKKFTPDLYLFSHVSIVASVDTEEDGHTIKPACVELINSNGNAWTNPLLLATFRSFIGGFNFLEHCFPAGTRVLMEDGTYKEIQDIRAGERIINRLGVPDVVKNVQSNKSDSLVCIKSDDILSRNLFVTDNHPFWIYHADENCPKTGKPNGFLRDHSFFKLNSWIGFAPGVHRKAGETFEGGVKPGWKNAGDIDANRDFLTHPVSDLEIPNDEINENRAELIGWFLAEGSYSHVNIFSDADSGVVFNLGNDEQDVAERISNLLVQEFGEHFRTNCKPRIYETESGSINVCLCNKKVAEFFFKWCGKYSWAKKLNSDAMWLPKKLQALILKHCINGDGCGTIVSRGYSLEMKTQKLIQQFVFISWRLGLCPNYRETGVIPRYSEVELVDGYEVYKEPSTGKKSRPGYLLNFTVADSKRLNELAGAVDIRLDSRKSKSKSSSHIFNNNEGKWIVSKIHEVSVEKKACEVFNLEVENDNSYIAEGVVVHNCQIESLSKGTLLDAVLRPIVYTDSKGRKADVFYVDLLVATARKHTQLIKEIVSGELQTLSMGCTCDFVQCSNCGKVLGEHDINCSHLDHQLLQPYKTKYGTESVVAELCGRVYKDASGKWVGDPKSCKFIEASWVKHPAFTGAVLNYYVSDIPKEASRLMDFSNAKLQLAVDDIFKMRVADRKGMLALHVAQAELHRRLREDRVSKIANSML